MQDFSDINIEEVMPLDFNFSLPKTEPMYRSQVPPEQLQGLTEYLEKIHNEYVTIHSEKVAMSLKAKYKVILLFRIFSSIISNILAHSGFETQRKRYQKSEIGVSVIPKNGPVSTKN